MKIKQVEVLKVSELQASRDDFIKNLVEFGFDDDDLSCRVKVPQPLLDGLNTSTSGPVRTYIIDRVEQFLKDLKAEPW